MFNADHDFGELLRLVRAGDADAAAELVRQYEPEIRRTIRVRLTDPRLRRVVDSIRDLLAEVRRRLADDERYLAEQRAAGREWRDLADELGTAADTLRKKLSRALDRVAEGLDLEGLADGRG